MASTGDAPANEDRLPWLETADEEYRERPSIARLLPTILFGLIIAAVLVFAYVALSTPTKPAGNGQLIAAQEGDYKVKPDVPGGRKVEGEGDTAFATSEGKGPKDAKIDLKQMPEAPMSRGKSAAGGSSGGALVQLGSFPDAATANGAWAQAAKRFGYLAPLGHSVEKAEVNGRMVYRLRVNAGSAGAASELCGKLQVAGEACFIPKI